jgi:hypothetical protein
MRRLLPAVVALVVVGTAAAASSLQPPAFFLRSKAGIQQGNPGSYSFQTDTFAQFADAMPPHPERLAIVRPGEWLVLSADADLNAPSATLGAVGCGTGAWKQFRQRHGAWQVKAPQRPGAYEVGASTQFRTDEMSGNIEVTFGILVSRTKARALIPAAPYKLC